MRWSRFVARSGHADNRGIAAALGRDDALRPLLVEASSDDRQEAVGLAVIDRRLDAARLFFDAGSG
jgi:hypothetical protein